MRLQNKLWFIDREELKLIVDKSKTWSEIIVHYGLTCNGNYVLLVKKILVEKGIDFGHIGNGPNCSIAIERRKSNNRKTYEEYIERWKAGLETGYVPKYFYVHPYVRKYLFEKHHDKCQKCGWGEVNVFTRKVPLQAHHVDGDASNTSEENLELLCPNCHSLTPNFGHR